VGTDWTSPSIGSPTRCCQPEVCQLRRPTNQFQPIAFHPNCQIGFSHVYMQMPMTPPNGALAERSFSHAAAKSNKPARGYHRTLCIGNELDAQLLTCSCSTHKQASNQQLATRPPTLSKRQPDVEATGRQKAARHGVDSCVVGLGFCWLHGCVLMFFRYALLKSVVQALSQALRFLQMEGG